MIDVSELDDTPIEGLDEAYENYGKQRPVPLGDQNLRITGFNPELIYAGVSITGRAYALANAVSFEVVGGTFDSVALEQDGVNLIGLSKALETPCRSIRDYGQLLDSLANNGRVVGARIGWIARSSAAFKDKLMELTGTSSYEEAKDAATREQRRAADRAAVVVRSERAFPLDPETNQRIPLVEFGGQALRATPVIRYFVTNER